MATFAEAVLSAGLGVIGGLAGAAILERLKAGVASLDVEFARLETFEDDLFDAFGTPADHIDRPAMLRRLVGRRRRLGQNIRRKVVESSAYNACKAELVKLDGFLSKAEDSVALTDELEAEIEHTVVSLRSRLRRSSRTARAFTLLRGDS